jgi:N-acetylneuraminic acid mutarotase
MSRAVLLQVYAIGGYDQNYTILNENFEYDPASKAWTKLANMTTPRGDLFCVNFLGEVYALGGFYVSRLNPAAPREFGKFKVV